MNNFVRKVLKNIKNGTFFDKIKLKSNNIINCYFIKNNIVKNKQEQFQTYQKLKKKYYSVIENQTINEKSEKSNKVWIFWLQGIETAPPIIQSCIRSIKKNISDREIILLNIDNYKEYIKFPQYIEEKFKEGKISYTHFSDLLRIELLTQYGGLWMDATVLCTDQIPDYVFNSNLFVYKNIGLDRSDEDVIAASSWMIYAWSHNKIIETTRNLLYEYWKKEENISNYFLVHLFFKMATEQYAEEWNNVPTFNNVAPHILQFELLDKYDEKRFQQIKEMSAIHKLNRRFENKDKQRITNLDYIIKNY